MIANAAFDPSTRRVLAQEIFDTVPVPASLGCCLR